MPNEYTGLFAAFEPAVLAAINSPKTLLPLVMRPTLDTLNEASRDYFESTKPCTPLPSGDGLKELWGNLESGFGTVDGWYAKNPAGQTFFAGQEATFADVVIAARLIWIRQIWGEDSAEWKNVLTWHGGRWAKLMEAMKPFE